ncbi:putative tail spike protein [Sulfitobacter phage phiGT1]|nr:putative tail spike protein [Sulfitobacter phage phiGT1]
MLYRIQSTALGQSGNTLLILPGASVTVLDSTGALARIYADPGEVTELPNPTLADTSGGYDFYVAYGDYFDVSVSLNGQTVDDRIYPIEVGLGARVEAAATDATAQAVTATTQAGISTAQAVISTAQADIATTQAGIATTKAGAASTSAANAALFDGPRFATIAEAAAHTGYTDGGFAIINPTGETFQYDAASTATADGALIVDATGMGVGRLISKRTVFASFAQFIADARTFTAGTTLTIPSIGAVYQSTAGAGHVTNAGGQAFDVLPNEAGFNAQAFGALGDWDGTGTDDRDAIQSAFDAANGVSVIFPKTDAAYYIATPLTMANGATWKARSNGAKLTAATDMFDNFGASVDFEGLELDGGVDCFDFKAATAISAIDFRLAGCGVKNFTGPAIRSSTAQTFAVQFDSFILDDCTFQGNRIDALVQQYDLKLVKVRGNSFLDGGEESLNLQGGPNQGADYVITGNVFRNYTNNLLGPDADGHFIRCYGERAVIDGNVFDTLNIGPSTVGGDTEGLRPNCDQVVITNNVFRDAGMAEAVVTLKNCRESLVQGNSFECSDAYNAAAIASGFYTVGVLADYNAQIIGNTFNNFNGAIVDVQDGNPNLGTIVIEGNLIIDSLCNQFSSSQLFRLTAPSTVYVVRNNTVKTSEAVDVLPLNIFRVSSGASEYYVEGNIFKMTGTVFENVNGNSKIYTKNNTYKNGTRIIAAGTCGKFRSKNDTWQHDTGPAFTSFFGSGDVPHKDFIVDNMGIDMTPSDYRFIGIKTTGDCVGYVNAELSWRDVGDAATAVDQSKSFIRSTTGVMSIDATPTANFYAIGTPTGTAAVPAVISGFVCIRRPTNFLSGSKVRGKISIGVERV